MSDELVRVDQDLCTGDGLCVQYAPEVFIGMPAVPSRLSA
ncbi:MAG: ferredoxin [Mycobacteriales bacterium]|nr:ferredoxin [Mycobacteriales bacterium]